MGALISSVRFVDGSAVFHSDGFGEADLSGLVVGVEVAHAYLGDGFGVSQRRSAEAATSLLSLAGPSRRSGINVSILIDDGEEAFGEVSDRQLAIAKRSSDAAADEAWFAFLSSEPRAPSFSAGGRRLALDVASGCASVGLEVDFAVSESSLCSVAFSLLRTMPAPSASAGRLVAGFGDDGEAVEFVLRGSRSFAGGRFSLVRPRGGKRRPTCALLSAAWLACRLGSFSPPEAGLLRLSAAEWGADVLLSSLDERWRSAERRAFEILSFSGFPAPSGVCFGVWSHAE